MILGELDARPSVLRVLRGILHVERRHGFQMV